MIRKQGVKLIEMCIYIWMEVYLHIYIHICKQKTTNMLPTFPVAVLFLLRLAWVLRLDLILEIKIRYP